MPVVRRWALLYAAVLIYRLYLCAQPPEDTSDLMRHLGYATHIVERGATIYQASPTEFAPEFWTRFWPRVPYMYPPGALLFFAPLGAAGIGLALVKTMLTVADLVAALLMWRLVGPLHGLIMFSMPAAMWYTSHEGQYESLVSLALMATVFLVGRDRWAWAGATWGAALQLKQFALLLGPFLVAALVALERCRRMPALRALAIGGLIVCLPFVPFYAAESSLWLRPIDGQRIVYNPFHWNLAAPATFLWNPSWLVVWNAAATAAILAVLIVYTLRARSADQRLRALPALTFWGLLKSLQWAQFWYVVPAPALSAPLSSARLLLILLSLYWLQCGRSLMLLAGSDFGYRESRETIERFESCLWNCDYGSEG